MGDYVRTVSDSSCAVRRRGNKASFLQTEEAARLKRRTLEELML